jgi:hypothetical protein
MANSKIYLQVPYAQKDAAKALGARWDATRKKWYVPADKDMTPFAKWQPETVAQELSATAASRFSAQATAPKSRTATGAITYSTSKDFVPYSGEEPPWE